MLKVKLFAFTILSIISTSCKEDENALTNLFSIENPTIKPILKLEENVDLVLQNKENKTIDSVIYFCNEVKIGSVKGNDKLPFALNNQKLGNQTIKALVYFEGKNIDIASGFSIYASAEPKILNYKIVNTYPHDIKAYTQGFEFYNGILLEGTGQRGASTLRKTDYKTGKIIEQIKLEDKYFGEGIYTNSAKIEAVNELEWINGKIWANIYQKDAIAVINPNTGAVENVINCADLRKKVTQHQELDAFNGIAYHLATKTYFVTGKNWDKTFELAVE